MNCLIINNRTNIIENIIVVAPEDFPAFVYHGNLEYVGDEDVVEKVQSGLVDADGAPVIKDKIVGRRRVLKPADNYLVVPSPTTGASPGWLWDGSRAIDPAPQDMPTLAVSPPASGGMSVF